MLITAVIITHNEERNIRRCLESVKDVADEIVVVDSGSTDNTEKICAEYGVKFMHQDWLGYSEQKNFANNLASNDWILSIGEDSSTLRLTASSRVASAGISWPVCKTRISPTTTCSA